MTVTKTNLASIVAENDELKDCVRYLSKIIREGGNWDEDEPNALAWAEELAGTYEQHEEEDA